MHELRKVAGACEVRANGDGKTLTGYALVYNRYSQNLGGFVEQVAPGAIDKTIAEGDIRSRFNHATGWLLGRTSSGTLRLASDSTGLHYEVDLPNTQAGRDVAEMVERGDVRGSSFSFRALPGGETWSTTDQDFPLRTLTEVQLFELGPVEDPAYLSTEEPDVAAALRSLATDLSRPLGDLTAAAAAGELRSLMTTSDVPAGPGKPPTLRNHHDRLIRALEARFGAALLRTPSSNDTNDSEEE